MFCVFHNTQLVTYDRLKGRHAANLIGMIRNITTCAYNSKVDSILKRGAKKDAIINWATRWGHLFIL